ncbi:discoidin domain-containing protein [Streptomyces sp. NPDC058662]|uniref:discoidin domain-containing protein n=1 Tax=Streptomyces sp. NPDC058662 TaxID=3346583 RepID=UPI00366012A9
MSPSPHRPAPRTRAHPPGPRQLRRVRQRGAAVLLALSLTATAAITALTLGSAPPAHAAGVPTPSPIGIPGRGADVPFTELEAEYAVSNGTLIGPDRYYGRLPSEASGRQAVTLDAVGEYVEFTLTEPANAMSLRYSLPDTADGRGRDATVDVRADGQSIRTLPVTSKYSWYYGGYPFNNNPGDTHPHHFYDESRTLLGATYPAGTRIRVQVTSLAQSPSFTVDLADFERVAPAGTKPAGALDAVADFGADPSGATDSTARMQAAVDAGRAQGRTVFVPPGTYTLYDHVVVDGVTVQGAGPWHTVFGGRDPVNRHRAAGFYGKYVPGGGYTGPVRPHEANGPSRNVTLKDFAIIGDIRERIDDDQVNAIGGAMSDSTVDNLWIQHVKVAAWMDGPMDRFTIKNSRFLDMTADGVNFHTGVTNSRVTNTFVRNAGDDGLASWPQDQPNVNISFDHNTVVLPILANNIVTYGGKDFTISDNVMSDTVSNGGGLHIANRYPGVNSGRGTAVAGTVTAARNTLIRAGNSDFNWNFGVGAIWFSGLNEPVRGAAIRISDTEILDSSYAAIHSIEGAISGVEFTDVTIDGAGTYAIQVQAGIDMKLTRVTARNIAQAATPIHNCVGTGLRITDGGGNSGWNTGQTCSGLWPDPVWTNGGVPSGGGSTTPPPTPTAPPTTPPATPTTPPATPTTPPNGNLAQGRSTTTSSALPSYGAANAVDGNASTYWESGGSAFPQTLTVDLGEPKAIGRVALKLPPSADWAARTETLSVLGSTDAASWSTLRAPAGVVFDPAGGNSATLGRDAGASARYVRLHITGNTGWAAGQIAEFEVYPAVGGPTAPPTTTPPPTPPPGSANLARGRTVSDTGHSQEYVPARVTDGDAGSYWESSNNAFPQSLTVDLGAERTVGRLVLRLPPAWATRTQTLSVHGSTDNSAWSTLKAPAGHAFTGGGAGVSIPLPASGARYVRLTFTGNTGWPAGQLSELEVYAP